MGLEANYWAIQVLGGAGYTRDFPVERYYRDNRLNPIHEGTNTIQALDLLGRKTLGPGALLWDRNALAPIVMGRCRSGEQGIGRQAERRMDQNWK